MDKIGVFVIDPAWPQKKGGLRETRKNQGRNLDYRTMSVNDIFDLLDNDIFPLAQTDHCVFMWTIEKFLLSCEEEMIRRGYKRHCRMIWDKMNGVAPAFTVRFTHEYLIWYYKGRLPDISVKQRGKFPTVFREYGRQHSRKPEFSYQMIETLYPDCIKMDMFSREYREGWLQYGDQLDFFNRNSQINDNSNCNAHNKSHQISF